MSYDPNARRDTPLALKLKARMQAGAIPLGDYITACLWDEAFGYYATRRPIGASGDFITAPEISQTFGELIGLWSAVVWQQMGEPGAVTLVEAGPGRGTLMRDALRAVDKVPRYRAALNVHLLEASSTLREMQRATLESCKVPLTWSARSEAWCGPLILVGNEFLDCLPVDQAVKSDHGWRLRGVGLDASGHFTFEDTPGLQAADEIERQFPDVVRGNVFEFARDPEPLLMSRSPSEPVAALYIDYGHATPQLGETVQAVRAHRHEHILTSPGEADVSAYVDFSAVAAAAVRKGYAVDGPVTQAEFLGALGIMERASRLMAANPAKANEIEMGVARLMAPNGMGTRFKVLGVRSPNLPPLPGFPPR